MGFVVGVFEADRVSSLARSFDFEKTDEQVAAENGEVGTGLQILDLGLTNHVHRLARQTQQLDDLPNQNVQWGPQLLLRFTGRPDAGKLFYVRIPRTC